MTGRDLQRAVGGADGNLTALMSTFRVTLRYMPGLQDREMDLLTRAVGLANSSMFLTRWEIEGRAPGTEEEKTVREFARRDAHMIQQQ